METTTQDVGPKPKVHLTAIGGDLRLTGREGTTLEAQAPPRGELSVTAHGDHIEVSSRASLLIFVPEGAEISADSVGGDGRITGLAGDLQLGSIGGDLSLRRVSRCEVGRVGGDLSAHRVRGDLHISWAGGDAVVDDVEGDLRIDSLGGDLELRDVGGSIHTVAGGDIWTSLEPSPGTESSIRAGGDLSCRVASGASVRLTLRAGGDLHAAIPGEREGGNGDLMIRLGAGEAAAELSAGGDLSVHPASATVEPAGAEWAVDLRTRIEAQVDAALAEVEASLGAHDTRALGIDREQMRARVRRAAERAHRRAERARERHEAGPRRVDVNFGPFGTSRPSASDEERLTVLRMLEQGTISLDEAERLLRALEGGA
jgi:hypothetical protein